MKNVWRWLVVAAAPAIILSMNVPQGLTPQAWKIFAVYAAAILGLILQPASISATLLTIVAFGTFLIPTGQILSGYANGTLWLVFSAFLITQTLIDPGLG